MEIELDVDEDYETDVEIDFSKYSKEEKAKIISAIKNDKKHTFKNINIKFTGTLYKDLDIEPLYNEGYC